MKNFTPYAVFGEPEIDLIHAAVHLTVTCNYLYFVCGDKHASRKKSGKSHVTNKHPTKKKEKKKRLNSCFTLKKCTIAFRLFIARASSRISSFSSFNIVFSCFLSSSASRGALYFNLIDLNLQCSLNCFLLFFHRFGL